MAPPVQPLLPADEVLARLLAAIQPLARVEDIATPDAAGLVLATDVVSTLDVPPADNSAMDGYAMRVADVPAAGTVLPISQRIAAGHPGTTLQPGTAARLFTGAPVPDGADAVVMQEQCEALAADAAAGAGERDGNGQVGSQGEGARTLGAVRVQAVPVDGQNIRRRGEDVPSGATVLTAGRRLDPGAIGLAAAVGAATLRVAARPRVALFSTGDELVMPGEPLPPGAIYNSNRFMLRALLASLGAQVTDLGNVPDRLDATRAALRQAAEGHDLIVTSGGVSVGEEDHLKAALAAEGRLDLWSLAIKPGKPLAFGAVRQGDAADARHTWYLGLPGNPVSSYVTFLLFVRPVLLRMQGVADVAPAAYAMRADFDWPKPDRRREFLRARRNADGGLDLYPHQGSGVLTSVAWADGLVDVPPGQPIQHGDTVRFLPLALLAP